MLTVSVGQWFRFTLICIIVFAASINTFTGICPPETVVSQGRLQGRWFPTRGGRLVAGFLGIPYAAPPVGALRFQSPQPAGSWQGVLAADQEVPGCIQDLGSFMVTVTNEDCLYINVFTPSFKPRSKMAVIVFFHGGFFELGSGNSSVFGPDYLLDEDVVLVTFNYRLGILGFLSLEDPVLPGNLGLKDQRMALRWVKDNIFQFGGDPSKVTLFGQSAGAASVHYQTIFSVKYGLFRAAIANSGTARSLFAFQRPGTQRPMVAEIIQRTSCPGEPESLVQCLRSLPADRFVTLLNEIKKKMGKIKRHRPVFAPVVEPDCVEDALITTNPWNTTTCIPLLNGNVMYEGLVRTISYEKDSTDELFRELDETYQDTLPHYLFFDEKAKNPAEVAKMLKKFYFGNRNIERSTYINLVKLAEDAFYKYGQVVSTRANRANTYFYYINYRGSNSIVHLQGSTANYGVSHFDDMFYFFPIGGPTIRNITIQDTMFSRKLIKMWTNFASYLDPSRGLKIKWTPVKTSSIEYLNFGQNDFCMKSNYLKQRMDFWDSLPFRNKQQTGRPTC